MSRSAWFWLVLCAVVLITTVFSIRILGGGAAPALSAEVRTGWLGLVVRAWMDDASVERLPESFSLSDLVHAPPAYVEPGDLVDPWGNQYQLTLGEDGFQILSLGADGAPGGEGTSADIVRTFSYR